MTTTSDTHWLGEIDCGFASYVVPARKAFEVKIEGRLRHVACLCASVLPKHCLGKQEPDCSSQAFGAAEALMASSSLRNFTPASLT